MTGVDFFLGDVRYALNIWSCEMLVVYFDTFGSLCFKSAGIGAFGRRGRRGRRNVCRESLVAARGTERLY